MTLSKTTLEPTQVLLSKAHMCLQMAAANVVDVIARLPDCDGQAADAVSAYTRVQLEDAPRLLNIPKSECPMYGYIFQDRNGPNHGQTLKIPCFLSNEIYLILELDYVEYEHAGSTIPNTESFDLICKMVLQVRRLRCFLRYRHLISTEEAA